MQAASHLLCILSPRPSVQQGSWPPTLGPGGLHSGPGPGAGSRGLGGHVVEHQPFLRTGLRKLRAQGHGAAETPGAGWGSAPACSGCPAPPACSLKCSPPPPPPPPSPPCGPRGPVLAQGAPTSLGDRSACVCTPLRSLTRVSPASARTSRRPSPAAGLRSLHPGLCAGAVAAASCCPGRPGGGAWPPAFGGP